MRNSGLDEAQAGIKIAGRNINNLRYADDTSLMAESEEELKGLLMKEEGKKVVLKLNIKKRWQKVNNCLNLGTKYMSVCYTILLTFLNVNIFIIKN